MITYLFTTSITSLYCLPALLGCLRRFFYSLLNFFCQRGGDVILFSGNLWASISDDHVINPLATKILHASSTPKGTQMNQHHFMGSSCKGGRKEKEEEHFVRFVGIFCSLYFV